MKSAYFDASVLVSLLVADAGTETARAIVLTGPTPLVSNFAAAEVASAMNLQVRSGRLTSAEARAALDSFDLWSLQVAERVEILPADITRAADYLRRLDLPLRTPDAIHVAVAERLGAPLATLDRRMADAAHAIGLQLASA